MLSDYTFLTDHSYSLRPIGDDHNDDDDDDELSLKKREEKNKKPRRPSNRTNQTASTTTRGASMDRSSSDKENNSSSSVALLTVAKQNPSIRALRGRIAMAYSGKKSESKTTSKTSVKSTSRSITKKKKVINRGKSKVSNIFPMDSSDAISSLSIEERVKLRRTKAVPPSPPIANKKSKSPKRSIMKNSSKKGKPRETSSVKPTKSFLGSGLDLDNIVPGNRQRRCVQT